MEVARDFVVRKGVEGLNQSKQKPNGEVESSKYGTGIRRSGERRKVKFERRGQIPSGNDQKSVSYWPD